MLTNGRSLDEALREIDVQPAGHVVLHTLPHLSVRGPRQWPQSRIVAIADIDEAALEAETCTQVITPTTPITGLEASLNVEQLMGWVRDAAGQAQAEGGHGLIVGYDALNPERRIDPADLGITDECVFDWLREPGIPPMFEWADVARFSANRGSPTAEIYLVDGRTVFLHADVDWHNRLS